MRSLSRHRSEVLPIHRRADTYSDLRMAALALPSAYISTCTDTAERLPTRPHHHYRDRRRLLERGGDQDRVRRVKQQGLPDGARASA